MGMMYEYEDCDRERWAARITPAGPADLDYWRVLIPRRPVTPRPEELEDCLADFERQMGEGK